MKVGNSILAVATLVFLFGNASFGDTHKLVCESKSGLNPIKIEITAAPLKISVLKQDAEDPTQWKATPYWDENHRCGIAVSDDDLKTTKCETTDNSSDDYFGLSFGCYPANSDSSDPYVWGQVEAQLSSGRGLLNCVSRHFDLINCK